MRLFDPDGPLMNALSKLADIVICNILFVLCSLPVVTIGASLTALCTCMLELVYEGEASDGLIFRDFWYSFRANFKQATILWLFCLAAFGFLFLYYWFAHSMAGAMGKTYQITFYALVLVFLFGFLYLFPLQARYQNKVRHTIRNAWLLSVAALPWTLLCLVVIALAVYISFFMKPESFMMGIYIWAVCGFGVVTYLCSFFFRRAFRKISPEKLQGETAVAEGAVFIDEEHRTEDLMTPHVGYSDPDWNRRDDLFPPEEPKSKGKRRRGRR